jgi:hypothetical protein
VLLAHWRRTQIYGQTRGSNNSDRSANPGPQIQVPRRSNVAKWYLADELNADLHFVGVRPYRWTSEANWSERQDSNLRLHPSKGCRLATDLLPDGGLLVAPCQPTPDELAPRSIEALVRWSPRGKSNPHLPV